MKDTATGEGMMIMKKITKYQVSNPFFLEGVRMEKSSSFSLPLTFCGVATRGFSRAKANQTPFGGPERALEWNPAQPDLPALLATELGSKMHADNRFK